MNLSAASNALREFNKSASLIIYNLTAFTSGPAVFQDGVRIVQPGQTQGGAVSNLSWNQSTYILTFNVSHWTNYSWGTYGINLTNISALTNTTLAGGNATYFFTIQNNGTEADSYYLTVSPGGASVSALNVSGNITFASNGMRTLMLNVTTR